jgi:hypothetical protein
LQRYIPLAAVVVALAAAGADGVRALPPAGPWRGRLAALFLAVLLSASAVFSIVGAMSCATPLRFFETMRAANPGDVIPLGAVAQTLNGMRAPAREVEKRVVDATALDSAHPQVARLHDMMIKRYLDDGLSSEALRFCDWSLSFHPRDSDKIALRSVALACLGRYEEALAGMDQALAARPGSDAYRRLRGEIESNMKRGQR